MERAFARRYLGHGRKRPHVVHLWCDWRLHELWNCGALNIINIKKGKPTWRHGGVVASHKVGSQVSFGPGAFLCGQCMFFTCLHGFSPASSYSPKTWARGELGRRCRHHLQGCISDSGQRLSEFFTVPS